MEPSNTIYCAIGKLFYAIASVDNNVNDVEYKKVESLIRQEAKQSKETKFVINPEGFKQTLICFQNMHQARINAYEAFKEFVSYKKAHEKEFTLKIKKWIWHFADSITYSFANKNKGEVIILSKLKNILEN